MLEELFGPFVPTKDLITTVELTREVGEGKEVEEETYTEKVLADDDEIKVARERFLACVFLAGVDRESPAMRLGGRRSGTRRNGSMPQRIR